MARRFVEREGVRLAYLERGDGSPTVLLHGLRDRAETWEPLALPGRTLALDARGHGESSWDVGFAFDDLVADVVAVMDAAGLSRTDLVGHSMGAIVAYLVAMGAGSTLVVLGADSPLRAEGSAVAERIPGARAVTLAAGHEVRTEQPQAFRSLVCEFLA